MKDKEEGLGDQISRFAERKGFTCEGEPATEPVRGDSG